MVERSPKPLTGDKETTLAAYESHAPEIAAKFDSIGPRHKDIRRAFSFVAKPNPRVVEVGCGNGRDAQIIREYTNDYLGFDLSPRMIGLAREKCPDMRFEIADLGSFEIPDRTDVIFSFASLLHSDRNQVADFLRRAEAAMAPGGIVYLSLKHGEYGRKTCQDKWGSRVFYTYTVGEIDALAGEGLHRIHEAYQHKNETKWFTSVLRKLDEEA